MTTPSIQGTLNSLLSALSSKIKIKRSNADLPPDIPETEDLFKFTRGRFVVNEQYEMSQRYVRFNVQQLARIAAEAVGSKTCVNIEKYPDGMFNKALLLTMEDGNQVVAKIPNPNAGRPHFTTASEVATMDFVRNRLRTPVPKIYAWSSRAQDNPVGAEYIIMEKVSGIQLDAVWKGMDFEDRVAILTAIAKYQKSWMSTSFTQFGSLYYTDDLPGSKQSLSYIGSNGDAVIDPKFAVGPSTARSTNDDGRSTIDFDRGPWNTLEEWAVASGDQEATCVRNMTRIPRSPVNLCGPGTYQTDREKKLKALNCYSKIMPYLLPTDRTIQSSCLWHVDLHAENIFVDPKKPTEVVSIIDWQSASLEPLFMRGQQPYFLDYEGPSTIGLERPRLPEDLKQMDPKAQRKAKALYYQQSLVVYYRTLVSKQMPRLYRAFEFQDTKSFDLLLLPRSLLVDGEAHYLAQVRDLEPDWAELSGVQAHGNPPFPLHFSEEEKSEIEADVKGADQGMGLMRGVKKGMGMWWPEQGCVSPERFEGSIKALQEMKEQVIDLLAKNDEDRREWEACWPFHRQ